MKFFLTALMLPLGVLAQTAMPTEFPADAAALAPEQLQQRLAGKVYRAKITDGATWRLEYKDNGYVFLNTGSGYSDSGKWSVQGTQMCISWTKGRPGCVETRATNELLYIKRENTGEVVALRLD